MGFFTIRRKLQKKKSDSDSPVIASPCEEPVTERLSMSADEKLPSCLKVSAATLIGSRKNQQDSLFYQDFSEYGFLAAVCDGMGGLGGGEEASQTACDGLFHSFAKEKPSDPADFFMRTAVFLDEAVAGLVDQKGVSLGAGTTITAVLVRDCTLYWLSVGDSGLYLIRDHKAVSLVTPHNYRMLLEQQRKSGAITEEIYRRELPRGEALVSYLGMGGLKYMDVSPNGCPLLPGDMVVLCSDGFYRQCPFQSLPQRVASLAGEFETYASQLARQVIENQPPRMDNTSLILLQYLPEKTDESENNKEGDRES